MSRINLSLLEAARSQEIPVLAFRAATFTQASLVLATRDAQTDLALKHYLDCCLYAQLLVIGVCKCYFTKAKSEEATA